MSRPTSHQWDLNRLARRAEYYESPDNQQGSIGNGVLYQLCKDYPRHESINEIESKVWLIGRAYAAAIERGRGSTAEVGNDDFYHAVVAPTFKDSELDERLDAIKGFRDITEKNASRILAVHGYLVRLIRDKITPRRRNRSFASKYLHFHMPNLFFIYDSRVAGALAGKIRLPKDIKTDQEIDDDYAAFFYKALKVKRQMEEALSRREPISLRAFDCALVEIANRRAS